MIPLRFNDKQRSLPEDVLNLVDRLRMTTFGLEPKTDHVLKEILAGLEEDLDARATSVAHRNARGGHAAH